MAPKESSSGKQRHSPASRAVTQAKHGKHQKAKQPGIQTNLQNAFVCLRYHTNGMTNRVFKKHLNASLQHPISDLTSRVLDQPIIIYLSSIHQEMDEILSGFCV